MFQVLILSTYFQPCNQILALEKQNVPFILDSGQYLSVWCVIKMSAARRSYMIKRQIWQATVLLLTNSQPVSFAKQHIGKGKNVQFWLQNVF